MDSPERHQHHFRRHSTLSGSSQTHNSYPPSPRRSLSIAEPVSYRTFSSSISTFPSYGEPVPEEQPEKQNAGGQLQQLHTVLKEQNTLLQKLAAKAAVVLEKRGEPIPENFLHALNNRRHTQTAQPVASRCLSSSFVEQSERSPVSPVARFVGLGRRHSLGFAPIFPEERAQSPLATGDESFQEGTHEDRPAEPVVERDVAKLREVFYSGRVELCSPVLDRFQPDERMETVSGDIYNSALGRSSIFPGNPGADWKYCVPVYPKEAVPGDWSESEGLVPYTGGCPNYVPPWEMYDHENGYAYHIDDVDLQWPFEQTEKPEFETHDVPYSFSAPFPLKLQGGNRLACNGLKVRFDELSGKLGTLFSVPPDGRIPLAFERNELRMMSSESPSETCDYDIGTYLEGVHEHLECLSRNGGSFFVRDYTLWMYEQTYAHSSALGAKVSMHESEPPHWMAAKAALTSELSGLMATPTPHYVVSELRLPILERARQWYRMVYYQGLESTVPAGPDYLSRARSQWELLVYGNPAQPRLPEHRQLMIDQTFEGYLGSLVSPIEAGGPVERSRFEDSWSPFHLSWLTVADAAASDGQAAVTQLGNVRVKRNAVSLLFLPHAQSHTAECFDGPSEHNMDEYVERGQHFWTALLLSSVSLREGEFRYPFSMVLEVIERAFERSLASWEQLCDSLFDTEPTSPGEADGSGWPAAPFTTAKPGLGLTHADLGSLAGMIGAGADEWASFKQARLALFRRHSQIFEASYPAVLAAAAADAGDSRAEAAVDGSFVDTLAASIDGSADRLRQLQRQVERVAGVQEDVQKAFSAMTLSLVSSSQHGKAAGPVVPFYADYFRHELSRMVNQLAQNPFGRMVQDMIAGTLLLGTVARVIYFILSVAARRG